MVDTTRTNRWPAAALATLLAAVLVLAASGVALGESPNADPSVELKRVLAAEANDSSVVGEVGVYVYDLDQRRPLFRHDWTTPRRFASNTKMFTAAAVLDLYGPDATFETAVVGTGSANAAGVYSGDLYLRGGGDPTFGSAAFIAQPRSVAARWGGYDGTGASVEELADRVQAAGITAVQGRILGDESRFDSVRAPFDARSAGHAFGTLSALAFDAGGPAGSTSPPLYAAQRLVAELASRGIAVSGGAGEGVAPAGAGTIAAIESPTVARIVQLMNKPSDNFIGEILAKNVSAFGGEQGTMADGVAKIRAFAAGLRPRGVHVEMDNGSGTSAMTPNAADPDNPVNRSTPRDVVTFLERLRDKPGFPFEVFFDSLPIAGVDGTLEARMIGSAAERRCNAKTGTTGGGVTAISGYCQAPGGNAIAFSILMEGAPDTVVAREAQDRMVAAIASYSETTARRPVGAGAR